MAKPEITIVVPVYNEQRTLRKVLESLSKLPIKSYEVIVIDDASKDKSLEIINEYVSKYKKLYTVIQHKKNFGKGAGIKSALRIAKGEFFVVQDADLEYDPVAIPMLLHYAQEHNQQVVYGSRFLGNIRNMPKPNYIANIFYNLLLRVLYGVKMTDMHTCYKMVRTELMRELHMIANGFDYAAELVSKLLVRKVPIHELPISFNGRTRRDGKKIDVLDGVECLYKLLAYRLVKTDEIFKKSASIAIRFIVVGALGFIINYLVLVFCVTVFDLQHVLSEIIGIVVALHVTFILHDVWTYRLQVKPGEELMKQSVRYLAFIASNSLGSLMTVFIFGILYDHMLRSVALLIAALVGMVWNYSVNKYITWRPRTSVNF